MLDRVKNTTLDLQSSTLSYTLRSSYLKKYVSREAPMNNQDDRPLPPPCRGCTEQCPNREECLGAPWRKDTQKGEDVRLSGKESLSR